MKALIYKELRLAMHPICYIFIAVFPLMILIPSYPIGIGFIYILATYPILFLGANKGQQSNDLLFTTLMPVRKKDIVFARIITVTLALLIYIAITSCLVPLSKIVQANIALDAITQGQPASAAQIPGIGLDGYMSVVAFGIIGMGISNLIYFPIYYKKGRSIVMSTLLTILFFSVYIIIFTVVIPYFPTIGAGYIAFFEGEIWVQFLILLVAIAIYVGLNFLTYKISSKRLEKVDF